MLAPHPEALRFRGLRPGDLVRLLSPASYPDQGWVQTSTEILTGWGLRVDAGKHVLAEHGYMAGHDQHRLDDVNAAYRDPDVRAIVTTRGGAGAYRILDGLDIDAVRHDPKPLVGFSDITCLHLTLWPQARMPGIHGCIAGPRRVHGLPAAHDRPAVGPAPRRPHLHRSPVHPRPSHRLPDGRQPTSGSPSSASSGTAPTPSPPSSAPRPISTPTPEP